MRLFATLLIMGLTGAAGADTELLFDDGSTILIKDSRVLFSDDETAILYPGSGNAMTIIEHRERSYMVIDEAAAQSFSKQIDAALAQMEAQLAQLPPEQRAMMREMMKTRMPSRGAGTSKLEFRRTGNSQEIAGFGCLEGQLLKDGTPEHIVCIATAKELGISQSDYRALRDAFKAMAGIVEEFASGTNAVFDLDLIGGIPIRSRDKEDQRDTSLVSSSHKEIDSLRLSIPDGFEEKDFAQDL